MRLSIPEVPLARRREILALPKDADAHARLLDSLGASSERRARGDGSVRGALALDWFFARGLEVSRPTVIDATDPATGAALFDHEASAVTIRCR